jgi:hypothetical protein
MEHSQYHHFPSRAQEGAKDVVLPREGDDLIGCFVDQVKLVCVLVQDLDEAIKEVKLLGEHGEEVGLKITELEALCKKLREVKTKLEGMVESRDELIMEFTDKYGYNHNDEDTGDEVDNDGGNTATPPAIAPPSVPAPPTAAPKVIVVDEEDPVEMDPEQEAPEAHEVILADADPELP